MKLIEIVSPVFFFLVLATLLLYHLAPQRYRKHLLLLASYLFYASWGLEYCLVLLGFTALNYFLARALEARKSAWLLGFALSLNALSFFALKALVGPYGESFLSAFFDAVRVGELTAILLPVGFSFYVLEAISYLVDVSRGQIKAEKDFFALALYFAYFPKLLAGPIERAHSFLPQIKQKVQVRSADVEEGLYLILIGLFRKIVVSDRLSLFFPPDLFSVAQNYLLAERLFGLLLFAFILYNDFAAYSAIVRGVSFFFGIKLKVNFLQPFFSRSFSDFWTRWHISLSEWLRDYIFFPVRRWLSLRRANFWLILVLPPLVTMLISGYWHGAYLSVIAWGGVHGVYLVFEQILQRKKILPPKSDYEWVYSLFVFLSTTLAWVFFAAYGLGAVKAFFLSPGLAQGWQLGMVGFLEVIILLGLSVWLDIREIRADDLAFPRQWSQNKQAWFTALILIAVLLASSVGSDLSGFVYQGF